MKGSGKILLSIAGASFLFLAFVHGQVAVFNLSYSIDKKTDILAEKSELYRHLNFEVNRLKAPGILEQKMAELSMDLTLPKDVQVVRVPTVRPVPEAVLEPVSLSATDKLTSFLGRWIGVAQAKTDS